jgi:hypothetical protein
MTILETKSYNFVQILSFILSEILSNKNVPDLRAQVKNERKSISFVSSKIA